MQVMPVEDERSMQRSMLAALLGGDDNSNTGTAPAVETSGGADQEADLPDDPVAAPPAAVAHSAPPPQQAQDSSGAADRPRTVFMRGLLAGTTEQQLRSAMSKFGPLKACRCCTCPGRRHKPFCTAL
jgi:sugar/nucleoside kinase (ribokinase family)